MLHHAPCVAARTHPAPLAQIRHQKVLAALLTARPRKTVRQNTALQIFPQVTLYVCRHRVYHPICACIEPTRAPPSALKVYYEVNGGSDSQGYDGILFAL